MANLGFITWTVHPEIFPDVLPVRWYGLLFAVAFLLGHYVLEKIFKKEGIPQDWLEKVLLYVIIGTVVGARLGHVLFYDLDDYLDNPIEILMIWHGGLASHGAAIGVLIALYLYSKKVSKKSMIWILDRVVISVVLGAVFIRLGNLMNHEIIGEPTDLPWGFLFTRSYENNETPVHPAQLYEAIAYVFVFFTLLYTYWKTKAAEKPGLLFGLFLVMLWSARFFVEFVKHSQGGFESYLGNSLSTGQWLSIPLVMAGFWFIYKAMNGSTAPQTKAA